MSGPFVLPETQAILDLVVAAGAPHLATLTAPEMRAVYRDMGAVFDLPAETGVRKVDFAHEGIGLRAYFPVEPQVGPVIVYFHGGGWVIGDLETHDPVCSLIAAQTGLRVVAVDYRLAPEHPYPAAHDDCLAAARFVAGSPEQMESPVTGIAVAGDSAGGNLAYFVAAALGTPAVLAQLLIYPVGDCAAGDEGSYRDFSEGFVLDRRLMDRFIGDYLPAVADRSALPVSPLLAPLPAGLPPGVIMTAGLDPLRDQGRALAARMVETGTEVRFLEAAGMIHGIATMRGAFPSGDRMVRRVATIFGDLIKAAG